MRPAGLPSSSVVRSKGQLSTTLAGEVVILSTDEGVYYGLNDVGARIWELLEAPRTVPDLVTAVVKEYEVTREQADADVQALVADLLERGLVVLSDSSRP